jgi:hypothetical protein
VIRFLKFYLWENGHVNAMVESFHWTSPSPGDGADRFRDSDNKVGLVRIKGGALEESACLPHKILAMQSVEADDLVRPDSSL